jgi:GT2 family glycosyltransferase
MSRHTEREPETLMEIFQGYRQSDQVGLAAATLDRALQTPEYHPEALIWKGIDALSKDPKLAFIFLNGAAHALPNRADVRALAGRSILAQRKAGLASRYVMSAWQKLPEDAALRMTLWQARAQSATPEELRATILAQLPEITAPAELAFVLKLLATQEASPKTIGVVRYLPEIQEIQGWAVDLRDVNTPAMLRVEANGRTLPMIANSPHPLLTAAGLPASHGGVRISIPNPIAAVNVRFQSGHPLLGSPVFAMPAFVAPPAQQQVGEKQPVDVLIPVYDGLEETLECINSAMNARKLNHTPHRLVVIDDMTPIPALRKALKILASKGRITLVQNPVNLGFIRSMNRAMALSPKQDVVWLNADTRVNGNWLDRLRQIAYSDEKIASVTPFTNNGELMSFPESRFSHPMPDAEEHRRLDELAQFAAAAPMEIETGCGFCLYIKRRALDEAGYLDEVELLRGYGEETDWCLRARAAGWRHVGAPNVFVAHKGGISFGEEKSLRVAHNNAILRRRYPDASARFDAFCLRDPIKPARQAIQRARMDELKEWIKAGAPDAGSGTAVNQLYIDQKPLDNDRIAGNAPLSLLWSHESSQARLTLHAQMQPLAFDLEYRLPSDHQCLLEDLRTLALDHLVFGQLIACPEQLLDLPKALSKPYRIICRDDQLLSNDSKRDWSTFGLEALSIELPWQALHSHYAKALPGARLEIKNGGIESSVHLGTPTTLLIADLLGADTANAWLNTARRIKRERLGIKLLMHGENPWSKSLLATGVVWALHTPNGLTLAECLQLAGCEGAASLAPNPGADWIAAELASAVKLPLYAIPSPVAVEAGSLPLNFLPFAASQV